MRSLLVAGHLACFIAGWLLGHLEATPSSPRPNKACAEAHQLNLENPEYLELTTGWGFTPDTCSVQAATMQGTVRVPTQIVFCAVGTGVADCKTLFDLRKKKE